MYEFTLSTVEGFARRISCHLWRWLRLPRSLSSIALYRSTKKLLLSINSITEEFKVARVREVLQYREF